MLILELNEPGLDSNIKEQVPLEGRVKIDLLVGKIVIEIKVGGSFGDADTKYTSYREKVESRGGYIIT